MKEALKNLGWMSAVYLIMYTKCLAFLKMILSLMWIDNFV